MKSYQQASGAVFSVIAVAQLTRVVMAWPVQVATVTVPVWASVVACVITGSLAIWAFRSQRGVA
jgi:hypothetical protein